MNTDNVILIVDDEKDHADVLVEALAKQCAKAIPAYTAEEALEIIDTEPVDLVITDLNLRADINGIDILDKVLAKHPSYSSPHTRPSTRANRPCAAAPMTISLSPSTLTSSA